VLLMDKNSICFPNSWRAVDLQGESVEIKERKSKIGTRVRHHDIQFGTQDGGMRPYQLRSERFCP
jgi:hypothetical protein